MLLMVVLAVGFVLFVIWVARKQRQRQGNRLHSWGAADGAGKYSDPLDTTGAQ